MNKKELKDTKKKTRENPYKKRDGGLVLERVDSTDNICHTARYGKQITQPTVTHNGLEGQNWE